MHRLLDRDKSHENTSNINLWYGVSIQNLITTKSKNKRSVFAKHKQLSSKELALSLCAESCLLIHPELIFN